MFMNAFYALLKATEAVYRWGLFLRGKKWRKCSQIEATFGFFVRNRGFSRLGLGVVPKRFEPIFFQSAFKVQSARKVLAFFKKFARRYAPRKFELYPLELLKLSKRFDLRRQKKLMLSPGAPSCLSPTSRAKFFWEMRKNFQLPLKGHTPIFGLFFSGHPKNSAEMVNLLFLIFRAPEPWRDFTAPILEYDLRA